MSSITVVTDELEVALKSNMASVNVDLVTTIEHLGTKVLSTRIELFETTGSMTRIISLFELSYGDQVFVMKQVARAVRSLETTLPEGTDEPINAKTLGSSRMY